MKVIRDDGISGANILYIDLENTPIVGTAWGMYEQNLLSVIKDTELLCFAYKINDGETRVLSRRLYTEKQLTKKLWNLFNESDIIVAHNGDSFDIKVANQYFIKQGLPPPSPYKTVDTKKLAKKYFRFSQNKLDFLGQMFFNTGKIPTDMSLWFNCMKGDKDSLLKMEEYNIQDVELLYKVYHKLKSWHTGHPNQNLYLESTHKCPVCGGDTQRRGFMLSRVGKYQRYQCKCCGAWSKGERIVIDKVIS